MTWGRDTANSKPSRRMVSIKTDRCSSPRPDTLNTFKVQFFHAQPHVGLELLFQAFAQVPGGEVLPVPSRERAVVDHELDRQRGFVNFQRGQRRGVLGDGHGVADARFFHPGHGDDVAGFERFDFSPFETEKPDRAS
jgi:hypothetical protein